MSEAAKPSGGPEGLDGDDVVLPFETVRSKVKGRLVRLGNVVDTILSRHAYPDAVSEALGQAVALVAMLGAPLQPGSRLGLQTRTDGIIRFILADYEAPGRLRGYANFNADKLASLSPGGKPPQGFLIGKGHLALTLDKGTEEDRYQGIVELDGQSIPLAALAYFRQSEQLPTYVRLAIARHRSASGDREWHWRAGGFIIQHLSASNEADAAPDVTKADEDWHRARILAATVEDHELLDPTLPPDRLLYRLLHEEGVVVFKPQNVNAHCRCSRERVLMFLTRFPESDLADLKEPDGGISVTCEFCNTAYRFAPGECKMAE